MEEKKESVNVSPDPSEQRAPLSPSADEAQAASAGSAPMDPAKCGAHEIHCIEQEAELPKLPGMHLVPEHPRGQG